MNIQSLPFRTGAGKGWDDGNLLLATWRWAAATEIQQDSHMLTELRCHQKFGDLGHFAVKGLLQLSLERAATVSPVKEPSACKTLGPPLSLSCPFSFPGSGPHSALGFLFIIFPQPVFWKSLVVPWTLNEAGNQWDSQIIDPQLKIWTEKILYLLVIWAFPDPSIENISFPVRPLNFPCQPHIHWRKEGLGEMNFVTSHIGTWKQGKASRVYFISTAREVSVPKIALIPASTPCYFRHLCKLICKKKPLRIPSVSLSSLCLEYFTANQSCSYTVRVKQLWGAPSTAASTDTPTPAAKYKRLPLDTTCSESWVCHWLRHADRGTLLLLYRSSLKGISWERPWCLVSLWETCLI